ncbi:MAG: hypothetical protein ACPG8W_07420 [Candidatus Promineifilaceae bacterium]
MTLLQIEVASSDILRAVDQLDFNEFETLFKHIVAQRTRRIAPTVSANEANLLQTIYQSKLNTVDQTRHEQLVVKMEGSTITTPELSELAQLSNRSEQLNTKRLAAVVKLSALQGKSFDQIMQELGLLNQDVVSTLES